MNPGIGYIRKIRLFQLNVLSDLSPQQLNQIPAGFNNNIVWNLGHLVAVQQKLCYKRSGRDLKVTEKFQLSYDTGSRPDGNISAEEVSEIKSLFLSTVDQLEADYKKGIFANYEPLNTRYEVTLNNIDEALTFLLFHEGIHFGTISALKRLVLKS